MLYTVEEVNCPVGVVLSKREKLSGERIVSAAMSMIDAEGEKAFSMRKLASALKVDPMAIYHHHANKGALIHAVMQAMMGDFEAPAPTGDWRRDLGALCRALLALARRHPGAFRIYETYELWVSNEHRVQEAFHATLLSAGFSKREVVRAARLLITYTEVFAVDEISGWLAPEDRTRLEDSLAQGAYPVTTSLVDEIITPDIEADFAFGLEVLLNGLAATRGASDQSG